MKVKIFLLILIIISSCTFVLFNIDNDKDSYINQIDKIEAWQNPKKINVYIEENIHKPLALAAFKQWDKKLGFVINFKFVDSQDKAQIELNFIQSFENNNSNQAGITHIYSENKFIKNAKILICIKDPITKKDMDEKIIYQLTLHEIAHALGAIGHSDDKNDILYPSTDINATGELSKRDINTVLDIYKKHK